MSDVQLLWQTYELFPYERELGHAEAARLLQPQTIDEVPGGLIARACEHPERAAELVYFRAAVNLPDGAPSLTRQAVVESSLSGSTRRQPTRYSVHGLHEYKGKFNPQTAQALLNLSGLRDGEAVFDPYCGSGTTMIEAAHHGSVGLGVDANPLAVLLTTTKARALAVPAAELRSGIQKILRAALRLKSYDQASPRSDYLVSWLPLDTLDVVERINQRTVDNDSTAAMVLRLLVSDLLRDYSLQEPQDLRIRRRKAPMPTRALVDAVSDRVDALTAKLAAAQAAMDRTVGEVRVVESDVTALTARPKEFGGSPIGAIITSPPYAMALPYIDTQRISLVWLGLADPNELRPLEGRLTGSREIGTRDRRAWQSRIMGNESNLPHEEARLCLILLESLSPDDGFRRQAVPALLYRYFEHMQAMFHAVRGLVESDTPYFLVVGHNRTTLGGRQFNLDTPAYLADIAGQCGWLMQDMVPLQTYQRYGLHSRNAVDAESLVHLKAK